MKGRARMDWNVRGLHIALGSNPEALAADADSGRGYVGRIERESKNIIVEAVVQSAVILKGGICNVLRRPNEAGNSPANMKSDRHRNTVEMVRMLPF